MTHIEHSTARLVAARLGEALRGWRHLDQLYRNTPADVPARELIAQRLLDTQLVGEMDLG